MKLIQLSDCHLLENPEREGYGGINPLQSLLAVLNLVATQKPDGIIVTGDISGDDSDASYQFFIDALNQWLPDVPVKVIAGNHDNNPLFNLRLAPWLLTADTCWEFGDWCIHGLDTRSTGTLGIINPNQLQQISTQIQQHAEKQHLLALHHHPVATYSWMDKHALQGVPLLEAWLAEHPVAALLHGHIHADNLASLAGRPVYGAPSTCWQWALTPEFGLADVAPGFRQFNLTSSLSTEIGRVA